jgi:amidase
VLARTVADAAAVLSVIAGPDPADAATRLCKRHVVDYTRVLDRRGLRGARIGVVRAQLFGNSPPADRAAEAAIGVMSRLGATIVDPANITTLWSFDDSELDALAYEMKAGLKAYLAWIGPSARVRSVQDVIAFNNLHPAREMPYFGQELLALAAGKGSLSSKPYLAARARNCKLARTRGIDAVMAAHRLDALVAPTSGPAALIDHVNGDGGSWAVSSPATPAAVAGYPHISVPMGSFRGLPMGISFVGGAWSEATLIKLAYAYEQATRHRAAPTFAATADVDAS